MSKKKRRRNRQKAQPTGRNRHHLLFQGRHWDSGIAKELRGYFVYYIPIAIHNELHNHVLHDIPKPPPDALKPLYMAWKEQKAGLTVWTRKTPQNGSKRLATMSHSKSPCESKQSFWNRNSATIKAKKGQERA